VLREPSFRIKAALREGTVKFNQEFGSNKGNENEENYGKVGLSRVGGRGVVFAVPFRTYLFTLQIDE
jgi:hypothetical protein